MEIEKECDTVNDNKIVGRGLYLTGSLFNHSCDPNMIRKLVYIYYRIYVLHYVFCSWYGNNRMMVLVDRCVVKSGDELCITYGTVLITHIDCNIIIYIYIRS